MTSIMKILNPSESSVRAIKQSRSRHTLPILAKIAQAQISNGFPEAGGGGASAAASTTDTSTAFGNDAPEAASSDDDGDGGDGEDDWRGSEHHPHPSNGPEPHHSGIARTQGKRKAATTQIQPSNAMLWRLPTVLNHVPVSRSSWFAGVKSGRYPKPVQLGARAVAWRAEDIHALVASFSLK